MEAKSKVQNAVDPEKEPRAAISATTKQQVAEESEYHVYELAASAGKFGTTPEVVVTALKEKGACMITKSRAAEIIKEFLKREVK